jgi:hypothetical protein
MMVTMNYARYTYIVPEFDVNALLFQFEQLAHTPILRGCQELIMVITNTRSRRKILIRTRLMRITKYQ